MSGSIFSANTIAGVPVIEAKSDYTVNLDPFNNGKVYVGSYITAPNQPAFSATPSGNQTNIATGTDVTIVLGTEIFDQGGNFASNTFTAPVTGKYQLNVIMRMDAVDSAAGYYQLALKTSNRNYYSILDPDFGQDSVNHTLNLSVLADMDASDTAYLTLHQNTGTAQTDITTETWFSGYLVC